MQGQQCVFCQLIQNPEQLNLIAESENFYVWHEYPEPRAKGQANIVPKEHTESVMDLSPGEYQEAMTLVRKVMEKAKNAAGADGVTVVMSEGETAGQMLPHMYIQIFPRYSEDENAGTPASALFRKIEMSEEEIVETAEEMNSCDVSFGETKEAHPDSQKFKDSENSSGGSSESSSSKKKSGSGVSQQLGTGLGAGPLGGAGGSSSSSKEKSSQGSEQEDSNSSESKERDRDEVRLDEDYEGKSFEWH